eukprot:761135-Prorocentrum_minimum.AAC.1
MILYGRRMSVSSPKGVLSHRTRRNLTSQQPTAKSSQRAKWRPCGILRVLRKQHNSQPPPDTLRTPSGPPRNPLRTLKMPL